MGNYKIRKTYLLIKRQIKGAIKCQKTKLDKSLSCLRTQSRVQEFSSKNLKKVKKISIDNNKYILL